LTTTTTTTGIGFGAYTRLRRCEERANQLGFRFAYSKHGARDYDGIALYPKDDELPIYSRDAEVWYGDVESCESFLRGFEWATQYYVMLGATSDKIINRKEQDVRNKQLMESIKKGANSD